MWNILPMPVVENFCGGVRVTFQRKTTEKTTEKNVEKNVEKSVEKVWRLMKQDP